MTNTFEEMLSQVLAKYSGSGDLVNQAGTRLIGHTPSVAPKAFKHVVYKGLDSNDIVLLQTKLGRELPSQYEEFLKFANGMLFFLGTIRIFGYMPEEREFDSGIHNYPPEVSIPNTSARIRGISDSDFVVGWYKEDGSYVYLDKKGTANRIKINDSVELLETWPDFETWLAAESKRLEQQIWPNKTKKTPTIT